MLADLGKYDLPCTDHQIIIIFFLKWNNKCDVINLSATFIMTAY